VDLLFFIWRWVENTYVCIIHLVGDYIMALVGTSLLESQEPHNWQLSKPLLDFKFLYPIAEILLRPFFIRFKKGGFDNEGLTVNNLKLIIITDLRERAEIV
jgi:hypothetical protein